MHTEILADSNSNLNMEVSYTKTVEAKNNYHSEISGLFDTHAHLDLLLKHQGFWPKLREDDLLDEDSKLENKAAGNFEKYALDYSEEVKIYLDKQLQNHKWVIQPTVSSFNFLQSCPLLSNNKIWILLGTHPEIVQPNFDLNQYLSFQEKVVDFILSKPEIKRKLVGIGECGLDYFYSQEEAIISTQKLLFKKQIELAIKLDLPLIIHCRDAFNDLFQILEEYPAIHGKFLIHCFTGNLEQAKQVVKLGGKMAVGGILTYNSAKQLQEAVTEIDLQNWTLETDLPFLAPSPFRGKTCLPEMITLSLEQLAKLKNIDLKEALIQTKQTAEKFFNIGN